MDKYDFILFNTSKYLSINDLLVLVQVSKYCKKNINIYKYFEKITKQEFFKFYKILRELYVMNLNTSTNEIINEVPLFKNFIDNPNIYKQFLNDILNNCNHTKNPGTDMCKVCCVVFKSYTNHIKSNVHTFPLLSKLNSFITTILLTLYH
jgi:hypothetical protein